MLRMFIMWLEGLEISMKIDSRTLNLEPGLYVRVLVEVDLASTLMNKILVEIRDK